MKLFFSIFNFLLSLAMINVANCFAAPKKATVKATEGVLYSKQIEKLSKSLIKSYPKKKNIKEIVAEKVSRIEERMNLYWQRLTDDALKEGEAFAKLHK